MKRLVYVSLFALSACGGNLPAGDITACTTALFAAGVASPAALLPVALATPSCVALGRAMIDSIIADVSAKQHARGVR
jgi:hypothetical protein